MDSLVYINKKPQLQSQSPCLKSLITPKTTLCASNHFEPQVSTTLNLKLPEALVNLRPGNPAPSALLSPQPSALPSSEQLLPRRHSHPVTRPGPGLVWGCRGSGLQGSGFATICLRTPPPPPPQKKKTGHDPHTTLIRKMCIYIYVYIYNCIYIYIYIYNLIEGS